MICNFHVLPVFIQLIISNKIKVSLCFIYADIIFRCTLHPSHKGDSINTASRRQARCQSRHIVRQFSAFLFLYERPFIPWSVPHGKINGKSSQGNMLMPGMNRMTSFGDTNTCGRLRANFSFFLPKLRNRAFNLMPAWKLLVYPPLEILFSFMVNKGGCTLIT